jgi:hypothetical protein
VEVLQRLKQSDELFHRQTGLFDDASESAAFEILAMKRYDDEARTRWMPKETV